MYTRLRASTHSATAKRHLARLFTLQGEYANAVTLLESLAVEFADMGMIHDATLAAVDQAEALVLMGRSADVAPLCRTAISFFRAADLAYTSAALTALAYLRECAETKTLTVATVSDVRAFFEVLPREPKLIFARPSKGL